MYYWKLWFSNVSPLDSGISQGIGRLLYNLDYTETTNNEYFPKININSRRVEYQTNVWHCIVFPFGSFTSSLHDLFWFSLFFFFLQDFNVLFYVTLYELFDWKWSSISFINFHILLFISASSATRNVACWSAIAGSPSACKS